jgi:hypothetical protein
VDFDGDDSDTLMDMGDLNYSDDVRASKLAPSVSSVAAGTSNPAARAARVPATKASAQDTHEKMIKQREIAARASAAASTQQSHVEKMIKQEEQESLTDMGDLSNSGDIRASILPGLQEEDEAANLRATRLKEDTAAKSRGRAAAPAVAVAAACAVSAIAPIAVELDEPQNLIRPGAMSVGNGQAVQLERAALVSLPQTREEVDMEQKKSDMEQTKGDIESSVIQSPHQIETAQNGEMDQPTEVKESTEIKKLPIWQQKWVWALVLLVIVGVVVGVVVAGSGGDDGGEFITVLPPSAPPQPPTQPPTSIQESERLIEIRSQLLEDGISSVEALRDQLSPQSSALTWIVDTDRLSSIDGTIDRVKLRTRYVLAVFYYALNGGSWIDGSYWIAGGLDECEWEFVNCIQGDVGEVLESITMAGNNLRGVVPAELQHLSTLREYFPL